MSRKKKRAVNGSSAQKLTELWRNSNTEEKILKAIKEQIGFEEYFILARGEFALVNGVWFIILTEEDYMQFLNTKNSKFLYILKDGTKVKPWTGDLPRRALIYG